MYTGDWGKFLNAALHVALHANGSHQNGQVLVVQPKILSDQLPDPDCNLPDLVAFGPIETSTTWCDTQVNMNETVMYDAPLMIWGGSRALFDALHAYSLVGKAAYQAVFVPTVAHLENMQMVYVEHPKIRAAFHCCMSDAAEMYAEFYKQPACLHSLLLHPVKTAESFWPLWPPV